MSCRDWSNRRAASNSQHVVPIEREDREAPSSSRRHSLSLRTNFSWTLAGNLIYSGCQWGVLIVLARLGSPEQVGQFALALAVTAPVIMLSNLQLRGVLATD